MITRRLVFSQLRPKGRRIAVLFLALGALVVCASADDPEIITFDAPGAGTSASPCLSQGTFPYLVNNEGAIGGNFQDENNVLHGMLRARDGTITAFDAPGAGTGLCQGTQGFSINSEGAVVGKTIDSGYVQHGMLRARDGTITVFDPPGAGTGLTGIPFVGQGTIALSISPEGVIAGNYLDANNVPHCFLRSVHGEITAVDVPGAGTGFFQGTGGCFINPDGAITGTYTDANNVNHGFLRARDGAITPFDVPGAGTGAFQGTIARGINPEGAITGSYTDANGVSHGFLRASDGAFTTIDVPGAGTSPPAPPSFFIQGTFPGAINPEGTIAGVYTDANNENHGFLRAPDGTFTTFDPLGAGPGDFQGTFPLGINAEGEVTGYYIDANNVGHGFLRTGRRRP